MCGIVGIFNYNKDELIVDFVYVPFDYIAKFAKDNGIER